MASQIITNGQFRNVLSWHELTEKEQAEFSMYDASENEFVRYKGNVYDLSEFMRCSDTLRLLGWQGISTDTYFSGVLCYRSKDGDSVIMARIYS